MAHRPRIAKLAITTGDLAGEIAKADAELPAAQRLAHLVVTQFTDAFDPDAANAGPLPDAWRDWLLTRHPLPGLAGGQAMAWTEALGNDLPLPALQVGPSDLAVLPYTSGTTGQPKGCMHPHRSLMHNAMASAVWGNATAENVTLLVVPMFHVTAWSARRDHRARPHGVRRLRHPAIQEACIIAARDSYRGETVKAVVVLRPAFQGQVKEGDILAWCRDNMAVYKAPRIVQFVDALPKSGSGKVMWRSLQEAEGR